MVYEPMCHYQAFLFVTLDKKILLECEEKTITDIGEALMALALEVLARERGSWTKGSVRKKFSSMITSNEPEGIQE